MARLDVHRLSRPGRQGYLLDVQAGLLDYLATRTVVPLLARTISPAPVRDLNPVFDIDGIEHVMFTQAIATVPTRELGAVVTTLRNHHDTVTRALDVLLLGF